MNKMRLDTFISDYGDGIHGTPTYSDNGEYCFINGNNLNDGCIVVDDNTLRINSDEYERIKRPLSDRTVLLSINGSLGKTALYNGEKIALGKSACYINIKETYSREFFRYILTTKEFQDYMLRVAHGSTIKNFAPSQVGEYEIELPDISEHKAIGCLLSTLDHKISNNSSICFDLEAMSKLLYDYWFVQFDFPDENEKPYKSSGGKMVWNKELKREIPEGWYISNLEPFIKVIRGVSYNPDMISETPQDGYVPLVKSNNVQNDRLMLDDVIFVPQSIVSNDQYLTDNSIFVTMSSGSTEHVGKTAIITFDTPYCFGAFCSKIMVNPEYRCFVSLFFLSEYFKKHIRSIIVGTSIKNINNNHLIDNVIAIPPEHVLQRFESIINPLLDKQGSIIQENQQLKSLRDFLLPMLMNGQLKVNS